MAHLMNTESVEIATSSPEPVWDCAEAARFLRLHPKTVKRMARDASSGGGGIFGLRTWTHYCGPV